MRRGKTGIGGIRPKIRPPAYYRNIRISGFEPGRSYPTVNLAALQEMLLDLSLRLAGEAKGAKRWPIASVILDFQVKVKG